VPEEHTLPEQEATAQSVWEFVFVVLLEKTGRERSGSIITNYPFYTESANSIISPKYI
jgi:hypothetical protein